MTNAVAEVKAKTLAEAKREMIAIVKSWPADGKTRMIPCYALRGRHEPATAIHVERVFVELAPGVSLRSAVRSGKWSRPDECGDNDWNRAELRR
jgi:hypothetical protein